MSTEVIIPCSSTPNEKSTVILMVTKRSSPASAQRITESQQCSSGETRINVGEELL